MPKYLQTYWKLSPSESATLAILPLFFGGLGSLACGAISPYIARRTGIRVSRRILATTGFIGAGLLLLVAIQMKQAPWAMLAMGLASFFNDLVMPPSWAACMDIGGRYAGTLSGSMNMMGNLAGYAAPVAGGYIIHGDPAGYNTFLYLMAGVYLMGAVCWPMIDPVTPIEEHANYTSLTNRGGDP
jgi:ACS family glucarate transporter-like MFS transporter